MVHYKNIKLENSNIIPLKDITYSQLCEAKKAREALGGAYLHQEQCDLIPQDLDVTHHGYHRQCYKNLPMLFQLLSGRVHRQVNSHQRVRDREDQVNFLANYFQTNV